MSQKYPLFVKKDLDGFFGLFIDNLVQILAIIFLCSSYCGMSGKNSDFIYKLILPGTAMSILFGNVFYAWQAHRLAAKTGRSDVTALPYGINTPSMLVFIFFVIMPTYQKTDSVKAAWAMGLVACLGSGMIEFCGAFVAGYIRKYTPRAALLSTLAGIAIGFISMTFALQIYVKPLISLLPMGIILVAYFAHYRFPIGLPGGLVAVIVGTATAWGLTGLSHYWTTAPEWIANSTMQLEPLKERLATFSFAMPQFAGKEIIATLANAGAWSVFLTVIIPMGLFNLVGSLQNIESAEVAGDSYPVAPSLAVNGLGSIVAACFGSCFPTTLYIGHPAWKSLGARAGYSTLNGVTMMVLCCAGLIGVVDKLIPMEAGIAITLWIGIIITAQAFRGSKEEHAPAVGFGLFPAIAAWGATVMIGTFLVAKGTTLQDVLMANSAQKVNGFLIQGLILMERGYIFTCMILAAITACLIDRKFTAAAVWSFIAAAFAFLGLTHAFQVQGNAVDYLITFAIAPKEAYLFRATGIAIGYTAIGVFFILISFAHSQKQKQDDDQ